MTQFEIGQELAPKTFTINRKLLIAYANASGDQNPIHQDETFAKSVGLPDVIAHGMLTMGRAIQVVTNWVGDPTAVIDYSVRMTRPVIVPNTAEGSVVSFTGKVSQINDDDTVQIDLGAVFGETKVLGLAKATVRLAQ